MPPGPSEPASIPTPIKTRRDGIPKIPEALLSSTLINSKLEKLTKSEGSKCTSMRISNFLTGRQKKVF